MGGGDQTAERFIPNMYSGVGGERVYRSGDVCRRRRGGNIEYVGRKDDQVKVRGYRIELGEIEEVVKSHVEVKESVVKVSEDEERGKRLVAYIEWEKGEGEGGGEREAGREKMMELRRYVRERLPEYMVPGVYEEIERIPLTANGKIDRRRLPEVGVGSGERKGREEERTAV